MKIQAKRAFALVCGAAVAGLFAAMLSVGASQPASATPQFASQTGKPCGQCHQNPGGGGKLKPFGEKIQSEWQQALAAIG